MNRRIIKVLAVLLVLLCIIPVVAGAAEYQVGDTVWTTGAKPTADTEQYSRWIPVIRSDGAQEYREVGKTGTYEYQWIVEEYYGPGEKEGIPTSFAVRNLDTQGKPMVGTEFILFEERGDNLLLIASATTDEKGMANLEDLCLDDTSDTAVWHLVQTNFPESQMADTHHPYTGTWDVYVSRDASGEHTLDMVSDPAAQTMSLRPDNETAANNQQVIDFAEESGQKPIEESYNEKAKVLTVVNEQIRGELSVYVEFEDGIIPDGIEAFSIDVIKPNGKKQTISPTKQRPYFRLINLALGSYTIRERTDDIKDNAYNLKTQYTVQLVGEEPVEGQTVTLTEDKTAATVTITNCYEEINIANTVLAKVMDENGNLIDGAEVQLLDENGSVIRTVGATSEKGTFVFDDLADYAVKGKTVTFKIRQSKAPSGYEISEDQYIITVKKNNGKVEVSTKRDAGFFSRMFRSGEETGPNGETIIKFTNKTDLGNLTIKIDNKGEACPLDEIPVTVKSLNYQTKVTLSQSNGWQAVLENLPKSVYTIVQDADAKGYDLVDNYDVSGGFITGNQVELASENAEVTITNTYSLQTGELHIQMAFADEVIPAAITKIPVTITGSSAYTKQEIEKVVDVTAAAGWKTALDLPLGTYNVVQDVTDAQAEGYTFTPDSEQSKKVILAAKGAENTCTIMNQYVKEEDPLPEKIIVQIQDASRNPVAGVTVGLFETGGKYPLREMGPSDTNGQIAVENLQSYMSIISSMLSEGGQKEVLIKQTEVPEGYKLSEQAYAIVVKKTDGEITYSVPGVDASGTEVRVTFTNERIQNTPPETDPTETETGNLEIKVEFKDKPGAVTVSKVSLPVKDSKGKSKNQTISAAEGWKKTITGLPVGECTISLGSVNINGYTMSPTESSKKITIEEDKTASCTITYQFQENTSAEDPAVPSDVLPERIIVQMQDTSKNPVAGVTIGLFEAGGKYPLREMGPSDANGQIVVDKLQSYINIVSSVLSEGEQKEVLIKQTEVPEGYKLSEQAYAIVVKKTDGEITYSVPGVDASGTEVWVTFTNERIQDTPPETDPSEAETGNLEIKVEFKDKPGAVTVSKVSLPVKDSKGKSKNQTITAAEGWKKTITGLPVGECTITLGSVNINGYTMSPTESSKKITIEEDKTASCTITYQFKANTTTGTGTSNNSKLKNQIAIRTLDTSGAPLAGARYGLFYGATALRSYTDYGTGQISIDTLEKLLGNYISDEPIYGKLLTLRQTHPPLGGKLSAQTYDVTIYEESDKSIKVNVRGSEIDDSGAQLVDFIHTVSGGSQETQPSANNNAEDKKPGVIVIRTVDESGNALAGAEYCLSTDLRYDKDKDIVYSKADRHNEITLEDLEEHVEKGKTATYYLLQSRQPEGGNLSAERFVVELSRKKGDLEIEVKKDAGILERLKGGDVEESTTGEWIVTFCSSAKTTNIQISCEEVVDWHNALEMEDALKPFKKDAYEFQLNWEFAGEQKEPMSLKLRNGEIGSFDPIPYGAQYEIVPVQDGCYQLEFTKGEQKGIASQANLEMKAKVTYNIVQDAPLLIEMLKLDSKTEKILPGVEYTLKNSENEEIDVYKTNGSGKLLIDAITEPGEYTLSENLAPDGYAKLKKDIAISVSVAFREELDEKGGPVILQTLEPVVSHSQVRKQADGVYRIGTSERSEAGKYAIIFGSIGAAAAVAAGAGVAVLHNKKKGAAKK